MGESTDTKVFSLEEVKKHVKGGSEKDVWIVIHDNVYDVTKFLDEVSNKLATCPLHIFVSFFNECVSLQHPGGEEVLFDQSGLDGTESFEDVGHSTDARELMEQYLIGTLQEVTWYH